MSRYYRDVYISAESYIIRGLLTNPFYRRSIQEKIDIVKNGRPCPILPNIRRKQNMCVRLVSLSTTHAVDDIGNTEQTIMLPCFLFSNEKHKVCLWSKVALII